MNATQFQKITTLLVAIAKKHKITDYDIEAFNRIKAQSESARFSPQKQSQKNIEKDVRSMISILKRIDKRIK